MASIIDIFSNNLEELEELQILFQKEGFFVSIYSAVNEKNINSIYKNRPNIILLDLEIDNSDGIDFCYQLKKQNSLDSLIVLFAKHEEEYIQIEAFKAGADDYIIKPINPRLLIKRLEALIRRKPRLNQKPSKAKILTHNKLQIDRDSYLVTYNGEEISLPRKEFEMLYLLINAPQRVFTREEIYLRVWKDNVCENTRIIDVHIRKIREKVGDKIINTVKGVGYQLA